MYRKPLAAMLPFVFVASVVTSTAASAENGHGPARDSNCEQQGNHPGEGCHSHAAALAFGVQPSTTATGAHITPAPTVRILDRHGKLTHSKAKATISIGTNPARGTLSGITMVAAPAGTATFADL